MSKTEIIEIDTGRFVKRILDESLLVSNPMPITIPGIGKGIATSKTLYRVREGTIESYFAFRQGETIYEFCKRKGIIYQNIMGTTQ